MTKVHACLKYDIWHEVMLCAHHNNNNRTPRMEELYTLLISIMCM